MSKLTQLIRLARGQEKVGYSTRSIKIKNQNIEFLSDDRFIRAYDKAAAGYPFGDVPDIRWRAWICISAAKQALLADGDFVECGVNTGILSMTLCDYLDFGLTGRTLYLFDTFAGVPLDGLNGDEREQAQSVNTRRYKDVYELTTENFSPWRNAKLIRGSLPDTLDVIKERRIAYLSIDLNSATYEMQVIERLWSQLSPGAVVVLDDYGWDIHKRSFDAWNEFAAKVNHPIFQIPTGQGLIYR